MEKKSQRKIYLTFDYELFMKKSGTPEKCLIEPVDLLIKCLSSRNIKATFFVDVLYYIRLMEAHDTQMKAMQIKSQLQSLLSKGHRIELHLHPHWLDAVYHDGEWTFPDYRYYRLQALSEEKITNLFLYGVQILNEIAHEVDKNYKVLAFRAGGWCISPFEKLRQGFEKTGIILDSSVARGIQMQSNTHLVDFSMIPFMNQYRFSDDPNRQDKQGAFIERPIATYHKSLFERVQEKIQFLFINKNCKSTFGDGIGLSTLNLSSWEKIRQRFRGTQQMFSLENTRAEFICQKVEEYPLESIVFISHPKGLSYESFRCIECLYNRGHTFSAITDNI